MSRLPRPLAATALALSLSACATPFPMGVLYTDVDVPAGAAAGTSATKEGRACIQSYFGLIATGDGSVDTAKREGGITRIASVDVEVSNILGFIGEYCTVVRGN
ncbi:MAG: TRL-like family protein [Pseudomonadota bacterium]